MNRTEDTSALILKISVILKYFVATGYLHRYIAKSI
jgi:hypothetical protein